MLSPVTDTGAAGPSALSLRTSAGWVHATAVSGLARKGGGLRVTVETDDPQGGTFDVRISPAGEGVIAVEATRDASATEVLGGGIAVGRRRAAIRWTLTC